MKSLSQFLISEELPVDDIEGRARTGRVEKKYKKKTRKTLSAADRARLDSARFAEIEKDAIGKRGEEIRKSVVKSQGHDDLLDKINKNRERPVKKGEKFFGKPTGVDVKTGKAKYVPPKEIEGRSQYIDPKTNKASEKGIKSYINKARQMRTGSNVPVDSKTTDSIAKFSKSEYEKKINQKYGGRRAKRARSNAPSLADVQREINKKEYAKNLKKQSSSDFRKFSAKAERLAKETARRSAETTRADVINRMYGADGGYGDSNTGSGASTQSKGSQTPPKTPKTPKTNTITPIKPTVKPPSTGKKPAGTGFYTGGKHQTPGGTNVTANLTSPKLNPDQVIARNMGASGMDSNVSGSQPVTKSKTTSGKSFKQFSSQASNKVKSNVAKLKVNPKNLAGRVTGPAFATWNAFDNYKSAKGSPLRKAVKSAVTTTAYYKGFAGGAALGTAGGSFTGPGAFVTGTAGGLMGGNLAQKTASSLFNKVWKPPTKTKTKTSSTTGVGGGNSNKTKKVTAKLGGIRLGQ